VLRYGTTMPDSPVGPAATADASSIPPAASAPLSGSSPLDSSSPADPACAMPSVSEPSDSGSGSRAGPTERADKEGLTYTLRPAHGPPARAITMVQLHRGWRSICTECKRAQGVS